MSRQQTTPELSEAKGVVKESQKSDWLTINNSGMIGFIRFLLDHQGKETKKR